MSVDFADAEENRIMKKRNDEQASSIIAIAMAEARKVRILKLKKLQSLDERRIREREFECGIPAGEVYIVLAVRDGKWRLETR